MQHERAVWFGMARLFLWRDTHLCCAVLPGHLRFPVAGHMSTNFDSTTLDRYVDAWSSYFVNPPKKRALNLNLILNLNLTLGPYARTPAVYQACTRHVPSTKHVPRRTLA